jgi:ACT domain-containing protein
MENLKFKTKLEFLQELGISRSAFYRRLQKQNIKTSPELLNPKTENEIRVALGFPPIQGSGY